MDMKFLDLRNAERLKKKLAEELEEYVDYVRKLPDDKMIECNREISKKNQIFEYVTNSLSDYDSAQLRAMLATPDLLNTLFLKVVKDESNPYTVSIPVENAIDKITFDYKHKIKDYKDRKPTWFDKISGLVPLDDDEVDYYDDFFPKKYTNHYPTQNEFPKRKTLKEILDGIDKRDVVSSEELMSLEDTIDLLISFKKHENQQNHEMNKQLNKVLPKLKRMQYQKKFDEEEKQINNHIRGERIR